MASVEMTAARRLTAALGGRPWLSAFIYTGIGVLPLALVSAQILQLDAELGFGVGQLALATTTYTGLSALTAGPAGSAISDHGATVGFRIGIALTVVAFVVAAAATAAWIVPVATAIAGIGNGLIQVAANVVIFDGVRPGRQGFAYGAKQAAIPMASVLAGLALPLVGLALGWRWAFALAAVPAVVLGLSVPAFDTGRVVVRAERSQGRMTSSIVPIALAGFAGAVAGNGVSLFVVPSAVDVGISEAAAGSVLAACSILVVAMRIGGGWLVDRRGSTGHAEMMVLVGTGSIGALVLLSAATPGAYLVALPLTLLGAWGWPGIFFFTVVKTFPNIPARSSGLLLSVNQAGTLTGPVVVGWFAGRGDYPAAWLFVAAAAAVSTVCFALAYRLVLRRV